MNEITGKYVTLAFLLTVYNKITEIRQYSGDFVIC